MARRLRRSRYRRSRGYSRVRSYRRRRIYGKRRAASQQRQRANFSVKSTFTGYIQVDPQVLVQDANSNNTSQRQNVGGSAVLSVYRNLLKSSYFQSIKSMYDQVRVNSCKITITPTTSVLATGVKQGLFVSAWDRNGIDDPGRPPSISEITSHSSAFQKPLNLEATSWKATRKIVASTIAEKSIFIPTGMLSNESDSLISTSGFLNSLGQTLSMPWNPQLLIGIMLGSNSLETSQTPQTWGFVAQFEWSLTFRGLRYDVQNNDGVVQQVQAVVNPTAAPSVGIATVPPNATFTPTVSRALATIVTTPSVFASKRTMYTNYTITSIDVSTPYFLNEPVPYTRVNNTGVAISTTRDEYKASIIYGDTATTSGISRVVLFVCGYFTTGTNYNVSVGVNPCYIQEVFSAVPIDGVPAYITFVAQTTPSGSPFDIKRNIILTPQTGPVTFTLGTVSLPEDAAPPYPTGEEEE